MLADHAVDHAGWRDDIGAGPRMNDRSFGQATRGFGSFSKYPRGRGGIEMGAWLAR